VGGIETNNLTEILKGRLPEANFRLLRALGALGEGMGVGLYVVGGFVRDLLLNRPTGDLDLVVEGDVSLFCQRLVAHFGGRIVAAHERFHTATVELSDGRRLDVARARAERYAHPAALPEVRPATIWEDLSRRDFSINALALPLNPASFGQVMEVQGGRNDLRAGRVRVLHPRSFVDDPTRILRGIRFEQRFGFHLEETTYQWMADAIRGGFLELLTSDRLRDEFRSIFKEPDPPAVLHRLGTLEVLPHLSPALQTRPHTWSRVAAVQETLAWFAQQEAERAEAWLVFLGALAEGATPSAVQACAERFVLSRPHTQCLHAMAEQTGAVLQRLKTTQGRPSGVYEVLSPWPLEFLLYLRANTDRASPLRDWVDRFLTDWRGVKTLVTGEDLQRQGYAPGPDFKSALNAALYARLDGLAQTREEELKVAEEVLQKG